MWLTTEVFLATLVERRMWLALGDRGNLQLHPKGSYQTLSAEERNFLQSRNAKLKKLAAAAPDKRLGWSQPETQPQLQSQPSGVPAQPEVYARGVLITEAHVEQAMEAAGDLDDYRKGRISKIEAYERARLRQLQLQDLYGRY